GNLHDVLIATAISLSVFTLVQLLQSKQQGSAAVRQHEHISSMHPRFQELETLCAGLRTEEARGAADRALRYLRGQMVRRVGRARPRLVRAVPELGRVVW